MNNKGADETAQADLCLCCSHIAKPEFSNDVTQKVAISEILRLLLAHVTEQTRMSLVLLQISEVRFSSSCICLNSQFRDTKTCLSCKTHI